MITQIEIDGFKTFKDFKVELAPFQVIVGPNSSGKSNLFDALYLLSRLADTDLTSAFQTPDDEPQKLRGDAYELFTILPNGQRTDHMRIAVEMLVDRKVQDDLGREATLKYTRLRYELEVTLTNDTSRPYIKHESLKSIRQGEDTWCKKHGLSPQNRWLPQVTDTQAIFIDTIEPQPISRSPHHVSLVRPKVCLYADGTGETRDFLADRARRTGLSSITDITLPHVFAAREELRSLRFLHLNAEALRQPSLVTASPSLSSEGKNLAATLARMQVEDAFALADVSVDMANLVPGILNIDIDEDKARNQYIVRAKDSDQRSFSARVLSDGTLRLLALATLKNDPQFHGVLCLEEPETGVHPLRFRKMARLLREMATDFNDQQQADEPLRQVLVTTHSPGLISQPEMRDALLFSYMVMSVEPLSSGNPSLQVTCMTPVVTPNTSQQLRVGEDGTMEVYTLDQVIKYLDSEYLDEAREELNKARAILSEG